jgi:inosine-uridine nucleoside N-ribohydrolase
VRLWIDTDVGDNPDDAIALLGAIGDPQLEIVGVSTVDGDVRARAEYVRELFASVGAPVPLLYAGVPDPRAVATAEAILAIGPLTNLARLVGLGVELPPVAVMGGVLRPPVRHRGQDVTVDHNFAADPYAAALVVHAASDVLLVPLDVTAMLTLSDAQCAALVGAAPTLLVDDIMRWLSRTKAPLCIHDPATLLALTGAHVRVSRYYCGVDARGALVFDGAEAAGEPLRDIVTAAAHDELVDHVLALVAAAGAAAVDEGD